MVDELPACSAVDIDSENSAEDQLITLCFGGKTYQCSKTNLTKRCDYFNAFYSSNFADSNKTEHRFDEDALDSRAFETVVKYINTGHPDIDYDFVDLINIAKVTARLQIVSYDELVWQKASSLHGPEHCISHARILNFQTVWSIRLLKTCLKQVLWKFVDMLKSVDFLDLSASELYWILRNPCLIDPSGGFLALGAINTFVRSKYPALSMDVEEKEKGSMSDVQAKLAQQAKSLTAMLVFGLMEGLEDKLARDAPPGYTLTAVLPPLLTDEAGEEFQQQSDMREIPGAESADSAAGQSLFASPLPLNRRDACTIQKWKQDDNSFSYACQLQKESLWKLCIVGYRETSLSDTNRTPSRHDERKRPCIYCYDLDTNKVTFLADIPFRLQGFKVTSFGSQILLYGGEETIGSNRFLTQVFTYDFNLKIFTELRAPVVKRRGFMHCWMDSDGIVIIGGYEMYRKQSHNITVLALNEESCSLAKLDTVWATPFNEFRLVTLDELKGGVTAPTGALACVNSHILFFSDAKRLHVYCPDSELWLSRLDDLDDIPSHCFTDALPYGLGVYLTSHLSRYVYWLLLDERLLQNSMKLPHGSVLPPTFHAVLYGEFSAMPYGVCRVDDKLYGFSHDEMTNERIIEVLHLRYNPFDKLNVLPTEMCSSDNSSGRPSNHKSTSAEASQTAGNSSAQATVSCSVNDTVFIENILPTRELFLRAKARQIRPLNFDNQDIHVTYPEIGSVFPAALDILEDSSLDAKGPQSSDQIEAACSAEDSIEDPPGCDWCRLITNGKSRKQCGPHASIVSAKSLWRGVRCAGGACFLKGAPGDALCNGCFPLYDPFDTLVTK